MKFALLFIATAFAASNIAGWKETQGLSQEQAWRLAEAAIHQEIAVDERGQFCGIEEMWGFEREPDMKPDFPKERGEILGIVGYVRGPHAEMGCAGTMTWDCRVVFNRVESSDPWKVEYTECEPKTSGRQD